VLASLALIIFNKDLIGSAVYDYSLCQQMIISIAESNDHAMLRNMPYCGIRAGVEQTVRKIECALPELTKCPGCGAQFSTYDQLIDHLVKAHNTTCQVCGAKLTNKEELLQHNKEKHGI